MHNPNANLKTHVQRKQMYVGLHHLVQILYCNQTLCVCVLARPKTGSKTSFGAVHSLLPPKLRNSELHACSLFPCPFPLAYIATSYGYYCSCCSCNTKVEKENEVIATQEHKKPTSKRNPRNSKPGKICHFQH